MPRGGLNLGEIARVISVVLHDVLRSLCNVLIPLLNHKGLMAP